MVAGGDRLGSEPDDHTIFDDGFTLGDVSRGSLVAEGNRLAQPEPAARKRFFNQRVDQRDDVVRGVNLKRDSRHAAGLSNLNMQDVLRTLLVYLRRQTTTIPETAIFKRLRHGALLILPWCLLVAVWHTVAVSGMVNPGLMPTPAQVGSKLVSLLFGDRLAIDILRSTQRVTLGVLLGILLAVPVGFLIGWYRNARTFLDPLINFFRALPPIALIPLVVVYFGIDEPAKVIILFYASFFAGVIVMYEGVAQISPIFIKVSRTLGASDREIFFKVIVPLTMPHILTALRVALGVAWATLVASELVAAQQGLGALIQSAGSFFQIDVIYVGIVCIGTVALSMDLALRALTRRLIRWQDRVEAQ